jgi:hypothetical protein
MPFKDVAEYGEYVRNKVARSGFPGEVNKIKLLTLSKNKRQGFVRSVGNLVFPDGATLSFNEEIEIGANTLSRIRYSFHYSKGDYYFRYDKDPDSVRPFDHALCHLHVMQEAPRYITHDTSFEEVFDFIMACFYQQ